MIQIIENKVIKKTEILTEISSIDIQYQIKSIDEAIESMQIAKEVYLKDLEIILELEKQINEKGNRKK
jgi:predicted RNase H-like HicB family nuclease